MTRRSDDMHGSGFGLVKTGHVMSTKISFYNRAASQVIILHFSKVKIIYIHKVTYIEVLIIS